MLISLERVEELVPFNIFTPSAQSIAISGTIIHKLGHNLCLTPEPSSFYDDQPAECIYQGIDNNTGNPPVNDADDYFDLETYESSMNYKYQFDTVNYSNGARSIFYDHNDWLGVSFGMGGFTTSEFEWFNTETQFRGLINRADQLSQQEMIDAIQD